MGLAEIEKQEFRRKRLRNATALWKLILTIGILES